MSRNTQTPIMSLQYYSLRSTSDSETYEDLRGASWASVSASAASKLMPKDAARYEA